MLPPVMPSRILPANNIQSELANPRMRKPMPVPMIERNSTGRRPYLSDKPPRIGEKISCITE